MAFVRINIFMKFILQNEIKFVVKLWEILIKLREILTKLWEIFFYDYFLSVFFKFIWNHFRILNISVAVVAVFFLSWFPFHIQRLLTVFLNESNSENTTLQTLFTSVFYISGNFEGFIFPKFKIYIKINMKKFDRL